MVGAGGAPLEARVIWTLSGRGIPAGEEKSGGSGRLELATFPGTFDLKVRADGHRTRVLEGIAIEPGERKDLQIALEPGAAAGEPDEIVAAAAGDGKVAVRESLKLRTFLQLLEAERGRAFAASSELEATGLLDQLLIEGPRVDSPREHLKRALEDDAARPESAAGRLPAAIGR